MSAEIDTIIKNLECIMKHKCPISMSCAFCEVNFSYIAQNPCLLECGHVICANCLNAESKVMDCKIHKEVKILGQYQKAANFVKDNKYQLFYLLKHEYEKILDLYNNVLKDFSCLINNKKENTKREIQNLLNLYKEKQEIEKIEKLSKQFAQCETQLNDLEKLLHFDFGSQKNALDSYLENKSSEELDERKFYEFQDVAKNAIAQIQRYWSVSIIMKLNKNQNKFGIDKYESIRFFIWDLSRDIDFHNHFKTTLKRLPQNNSNIEVLQQYNNFKPDMSKLIGKLDLPSYIYFLEKKYDISLLEYYESFLKSTPIISDEALNIITKLILIELFQVYNGLNITKFSSQGNNDNNLLELESIKLVFYQDINSDREELQNLLHVVNQALFIPCNYVLNNNAQELFFYLYVPYTIYIIYLKSPYDSVDDIVDKIKVVLQNRDTWEHLVQSEKELTKFKMIIFDTEEALSSVKENDLINAIESIEEVNIEIIPVSIKSLGYIYKRWIDLFINIERRMNQDNPRSFTQISSQMEQEESINLPALFCTCKICDGEIKENLNNMTIGYVCEKHGIISNEYILLVGKFKTDQNQIIRKLTKDSKLCFNNRCYENDSVTCSERYSCFYPHSDMELKFWTHMKYFHKSILDFCKFNGINSAEMSEELMNFNLKALISEKRNNELENFLSYFNDKDYFAKEFARVKDVSFSVLIEEAYTTNNFEFINFVYEKYFKEHCFKFNFDPKEDFKLIKMVVAYLQQQGKGLDFGFLEQYEKMISMSKNKNLDSNEMKFYECLKEDIDFDYDFY